MVKSDALLFFSKIKENLKYPAEINTGYFILPFFFLPLFKVFWPVYIFIAVHSLNRIRTEHIIREKWILALLVLFCSVKFVQSPTVQTLLSVRAFAGLYVFYFYFRYINKLELERVIIVLGCYFLFIEFFYKVVVNFAEISRAGGLYETFIGTEFLRMAYPRPNGFGENSTITTAILVSYLLLSRGPPNYVRNIVVAGVLVSASGLGYIGLAYAFLSINLKVYRKATIFVVLTIGISCYFLFYYFFQNDIYSGNPFYRVSPSYIVHLISIKSIDVMSVLESSSLHDGLIGVAWGNNFHFGGDFGWMDIYRMSGAFGLLITVYIIYALFRRMDVKGFIYLSMFHYSVVWWSAGQIFLGYLAARYSSRNDRLLSNHEKRGAAHNKGWSQRLICQS